MAKTGRSLEFHSNFDLLIPISDVLAVYDHLIAIPEHCFRNTRAFEGKWRWHRTLVTAAHVKRASDQFDGEGIARDIDTQWGLITGGGAYKESDFYYD